MYSNTLDLMIKAFAFDLGALTVLEKCLNLTLNKRFTGSHEPVCFEYVKLPAKANR